MADFNSFFPTLLKHEGGYVDDPVDPGGATNKGVTLATFRQCVQSLLGIESTLANLRALTDAQAGTIYKALYWDKIRGDQIASVIAASDLSKMKTSSRLTFRNAWVTARLACRPASVKKRTSSRGVRPPSLNKG